MIGLILIRVIGFRIELIGKYIRLASAAKPATAAPLYVPMDEFESWARHHARIERGVNNEASNDERAAAR